MVTGPLELGLGKRDDLIAVTEFHEILVRAAAEAEETDQKHEERSEFNSV